MWMPRDQERLGWEGQHTQLVTNSALSCIAMGPRIIKKQTLIWQSCNWSFSGCVINEQKATGLLADSAATVQLLLLSYPRNQVTGSYALILLANHRTKNHQNWHYL